MRPGKDGIACVWGAMMVFGATPPNASSTSAAIQSPERADTEGSEATRWLPGLVFEGPAVSKSRACVHGSIAGPIETTCRGQCHLDAHAGVDDCNVVVPPVRLREARVLHQTGHQLFWRTLLKKGFVSFHMNGVTDTTCFRSTPPQQRQAAHLLELLHILVLAGEGYEDRSQHLPRLQIYLEGPTGHQTRELEHPLAAHIWQKLVGSSSYWSQTDLTQRPSFALCWRQKCAAVPICVMCSRERWGLLRRVANKRFSNRGHAPFGSRGRSPERPPCAAGRPAPGCTNALMPARLRCGDSLQQAPRGVPSHSDSANVAATGGCAEHHAGLGGVK